MILRPGDFLSLQDANRLVAGYELKESAAAKLIAPWAGGLRTRPTIGPREVQSGNSATTKPIFLASPLGTKRLRLMGLRIVTPGMSVAPSLAPSCASAGATPSKATRSNWNRRMRMNSRRFIVPPTSKCGPTTAFCRSIFSRFCRAAGRGRDSNGHGRGHRGPGDVGVRVTVDDPGAFNIPSSATGRCGRVDCSPNGCAHDIHNDEVW